MDKVLEAGAIDGAAAEAAPKATVGGPAHPAHTRTTCLNCEAPLHGRYCHDCGQSSDDHHRSIGHLAWEAVEGFTHLDGRLAQTLPALLFHPGALARDHIEGRRQRHVPPFRLFLICLLVFMFTAEFVVSHGVDRGLHHKIDVHYSDQAGGRKVVVTDATSVSSAQQAGPDSPIEAWLKEHVGRAAANHEYFLMLVFDWMHRLAVLLLPILAGLLTLVYVHRKQFYVYDHLVVAMQYLSFCFLIWAVVWICPNGVSDWLFPVALVWTPLNLYLILRSAYGSSRIGAGFKAVGLWVATATTFGLLLAALLVWTLNRM